jgi:succinylglutamic semialdehyde dehydrogenase
MADAGDGFIGGAWQAGHGDLIESHNPLDGTVVWRGRAADAAQVHQAVAAAKAAFGGWAGLSTGQRTDFLAGFTGLLEKHRAALAAAISVETGKPHWEAQAEISAMQGKFTIACRAYAVRRAQSRIDLPEATGYTRFRPHGAIAVFGPFNMPGHLPHGHILPALLAGNTIVFKPSELTPGVGQWLAELWQEAQLPPGVFNLIQGDGRVGQALGNEPDLDGLFFTGSFRAGAALAKASVAFPQRIVALEMGGNNPLVVWEAADVKAAVRTIMVSAFITAGQRCSCARRLVLPREGAGDAVVEELIRATGQLRIGAPHLRPEPFMGPLITRAAALRVLEAQGAMVAGGGSALLVAQARPESPALLTPGIVDVTAMAKRGDEEIFGPLLQVVRVADFEAAMVEAGRTRYGLSAAILTDRRDLYQVFRERSKAGVINWNRPTTGASSELPFGGTGHSGNHRPAGYYSADYCDYPVASLESDKLGSSWLPPGINQ